ncbi:hypothetical protein [uncultured Draconibacterium sp.]|uniref:hypothetical protein n=1 Tax=uncultured Draconibacterium sp. TaxID=1573823 RepID=UPI002AA885D7|nr:hypothetical protein [uncultured Draconibacterium sp.]
MKHLKYISLIVACLFACSCSKSEDTDPISFSSDIAPFMDNSCTTCHYGGRQSPDLRSQYSFNALINGAYVIPGNAVDSPLIHQLESGHPSAGHVSESQIEEVKLWIDQGAQNN